MYLYFFSFVNAYEVSLNGLNVRLLLEVLGGHINGGAYNRMHFCLLVDGWAYTFLAGGGGVGVKGGGL